MLAAAAVPAVIQFIGFLFMPESPRWLVRQNRNFEAMAVLQRIRGPEADIGPEYQKMRDTSDSKSNDHGSGYLTVLGDVMRDKYLRKALCVGVMLMAIQQLTGINTVMYYSATIIQMSGGKN